MPNLRKIEITIDFNGNLWCNYSLIIVETFRDILKHCFLQINAAKLKSML